MKKLGLGALALLLIGAGCSVSPEVTEVMDDMMDEMAEEMMEEKEPEMVNLRNNFIPGYNLEWDDAKYDLVFGENFERQAPENGSLFINNPIVALVAEGEPDSGSATPTVFEMRYLTNGTTYEAAEENIFGTIDSQVDGQIDGFDSRQYVMADGSEYHIVLAVTGYYSIYLSGPEAQSVFESIDF